MATCEDIPATAADFSVLPDQPLGVRAVRVLHVINGEHYSGAERVQDLLAGRLPEVGFEVAFACVKPGRFAQVYSARNAAIHQTAMRGRWDLRPVRRLARIVRAGGFALVHAHTPRTALVGAIASKLAGVPFVYHVHSPTARDSTFRWRNRANAWVERIALARAAAAICVSESLAGRMRCDRGLRDRVCVVPNGVPCREPRAVRPAAQSDWTLGAIALFRPRKGMEVLLESLAVLRGQGLPVRLLAVGDFETGAYGQQLLELTETLGLHGAVHWTGFTPNVDAQLARMDVFVLPSLFGEGLPMVVLEAMAAGVPVVATRVEGVPEAIRDGQDGLLAEPGDPASLARAVARFVRGEVHWQALRTSALDRHARCFSDRAMAAGVAEVYRRVLASGGARRAS